MIDTADTTSLFHPTTFRVASAEPDCDGSDEPRPLRHGGLGHRIDGGLLCSARIGWAGHHRRDLRENPRRGTVETSTARTPALSRGIGFLSLIVLVIGLMMLIPQAIVPLAQLPPVAEHIGTFTSPIDLPIWLNIAIAALIGMASTEWALRLRYNLLLDGAAV